MKEAKNMKNTDKFAEKIFKEFSECPEVEAIALGGSRASGKSDDKSDYDVYVYISGEFSKEKRSEILSRHCSVSEIGNSYWEPEDNCILNDGIYIDIIYRDLDEFSAGISETVDRCVPRNGYTTCMWHNLLGSKIIFDRNGRLARLQNRYDIPYPDELRKNIIERNMKLLSGVLPSYDLQIKKASERGDTVSINHRTAEFLASYFDIIFALNRLTHPGEKRLVQLCSESCKILPKDFEKNLNELFHGMFSGNVCSYIEKIVEEIKVTVNENIQFKI